MRDVPPPEPSPLRGCLLAFVLAAVAWLAIVILLRRILELATGHPLR